MHDVVGMDAPRAMAAGETAVSVPQLQRAPQVGRDLARAPADVGGMTIVGDASQPQIRIAGQPCEHRRGHAHGPPASRRNVVTPGPEPGWTDGAAPRFRGAAGRRRFRGAAGGSDELGSLDVEDHQVVVDTRAGGRASGHGHRSRIAQRGRPTGAAGRPLLHGLVGRTIIQGRRRGRGPVGAVGDVDQPVEPVLDRDRFVVGQANAQLGHAVPDHHPSEVTDLAARWRRWTVGPAFRLVGAAPGQRQDPVDVAGRGGIRQLQQVVLDLRRRAPGDRPDLRVGDRALEEARADLGQVAQRQGDAHVLAPRTPVDATRPRQPLAGRAGALLAPRPADDELADVQQPPGHQGGDLRRAAPDLELQLFVGEMLELRVGLELEGVLHQPRPRRLGVIHP